MITLGDIRKAGEGLPDSARVLLYINSSPSEELEVEFCTAAADAEDLVISCYITDEVMRQEDGGEDAEV